MKEKEMFEKMLINLGTEIKKLRSDKIKFQKELKQYKVIVQDATKLLKEAGCYDEEAKTFCDDIWDELPELLNILERKIV